MAAQPQETLGETDPARRVWAVEGADALNFLQGLVSNDVLPLARGPGLVWAALLTPQGKYLADFLVANTGDRLLIDIADQVADATLRRLMMYRLRADVRIHPTDLVVTRGLGPAPQGALPDPRHPALGWRAWGAAGAAPGGIDWAALRVAHVIPETGIELVPDETYILEAGFERLHGVDFRKGCYVGQEVTARMKHKTDLRKGLVAVSVDGPAPPPGTPVLAGDRPAGTLFTTAQGRGIAHLRLDRSEGPLTAGAARLALA